MGLGWGWDGDGMGCDLRCVMGREWVGMGCDLRCVMGPCSSLAMMPFERRSTASMSW